MRVALLADGQGGLNGVSEVYRNTVPALPQDIEVIQVGCRRGRGEPLLALPAIGPRQIGLAPEVDGLAPSRRGLCDALRRIGVDIVHVSGPGPLGHAGLSAARRLDLPVVAAFHTDLGSYARHWLPKRDRAPMVERWLGRFYAQAQVWVVPGEWARLRLAGLASIDPARIEVVEQGVDTDTFTSATRSRGGPVAYPQPSILAVSRLSPEKSLDRLIDAVALLGPSKPRLAIVGRGPAARHLRRRARRLGVEMVLTGALIGERLRDAYQAATIFCLPSPTETCGQVLLEAQASSLACVVSPTGAAAETIGHGRAGVIAGGDTAAEFAWALRRLLDDAAARESLGRSGRERAAARPWSRTAEMLARAYRSTSGCSSRSLTNRQWPSQDPRFWT